MSRPRQQPSPRDNEPRPDPSGLLLVDKPKGLTSHDVVALVRRSLRTRRVGHAGTLDPMATGLLVLLVGDATRVASHVTAEDKRYLARVTFGEATDSLDADGEVVATGVVPDALRDALRAFATHGVQPLLAHAIEGERARTMQIPPSVSALHVDGERAHDRVRRGEVVELPARPVRLLDIAITEADGDAAHPTLSLSVHVSKGYYVRSLARDLGEALGVPAHLSSLRRTSSGSLDVAGAVAPTGDLAAALVPLLPALSSLFPVAILTETGETRARMGKTLGLDDFERPADQGIALWIRGENVIAIGERTDDVAKVCRGFPPPP